MTLKESVHAFYDWDTKDDATAPWKAKLRWALFGIALAFALHWALRT